MFAHHVAGGAIDVLMFRTWLMPVPAPYAASCSVSSTSRFSSAAISCSERSSLQHAVLNVVQESRRILDANAVPQQTSDIVRL